MSGWHWSTRIGQADWVRDAQPPGTWVVGTPVGFEAYARILHPVELFADDAAGDAEPDLVRWADVAAWSGQPLTPETRFWELALPEPLPAEPIPCLDDLPSSNLSNSDTTALTRHLRQLTSTPESCFFAIWDGYGWDDDASGPIPEAVRQGPRVHLPGRDYFFYEGPVEAASALRQPDVFEIADLWWPADRAWCVYGDVDLDCTYFAGSSLAVDSLLAATNIEVLPHSGPETIDEMSPLPTWVSDRLDDAVRRLMETGQATVRVSRYRGTFWFGDGGLNHRSADGDKGGWSSVRHPIDSHELKRIMLWDVIDFAQGG